MAESAKVLPFRPRRGALSQETADALVLEYLAVPMAERGAALLDENLSNPDFLMALCRSLRANWDSSANSVAAEAACAYAWIEAYPAKIGLFDEPDFFRGEFALIAGTANRHIGEFERAEVWLHKAEAAFGMTVNPSPSLASIAYARVSLQYERGNYEAVDAILPTVQATFDRLGMAAEAFKCRFLQAMSYKVSGRRSECLESLKSMCDDPQLASQASLHCVTLVNYGEMLLADGRVGEASQYLAAGQRLLSSEKPSIAGAHLCGVLGEALNREGNLEGAVASYRAAIAKYQELGMPRYECYFRLALAQNLLESGDHRQAEWEVLAALPAIDHSGLEKEARVAVALLHQSARARKTDLNALGRVREHLKAAR
jgi:tetratricopeptide (TPR) repeat protein